MAETCSDVVRSGEPILESERLSKLALAQIEYLKAAKLAQERAWQSLEQAQNTFYRAAAKENQTLESATSTVEHLYESFNKELEGALESNNPSQFVSILHRYANLYVALAEAASYPSQTDFADSMAVAHNAANKLRENAQLLQGMLSAVDIAYIPLPSWDIYNVPTPAPVLATLLTKDGELALNLCDDSLIQQD